MSLITDLNKKPGSQVANAIKTSGGLPEAVSKLKQAKELIETGTAFINSLKSLASPFLEKIQNQNVSSFELSPTVQRNRGINQPVNYDNSGVVTRQEMPQKKKIDPADVKPEDVIGAINEFSGLLPKGKNSTLAEVEKLLKELK